jgi:NADP-dependent 3-hydroxy acid dehydrogenase YdfG
MDDRFEPRAEKIADQERKIQAGIDAKAGEGGEDSDKAVQAGARRYPEPPFPKQHQTKPGDEAALDPAPMYDAPFWKGSGKLEGMAAIITGGDSGIGRAVAVLFAREGCDVAICHLNEDGDAAATKAAVEAEGRKAIVLKGDAADPAFSEAAVKATLDAFGRLDVVVPNAAFQEHVEALEDLTLEHFDRTLKTNLYGYFHLVKAAVPHLKPGGSIVMTGSVTGIMGNENLLDYSMTKGGIHAFARSLGHASGAEGHPRERGRARSGLDAAEPRRPAGRQGGAIRLTDGDETPRPAGGDRPGLRLPRLAPDVELHHRRGPADHRRLRRGLGWGGIRRRRRRTPDAASARRRRSCSAGPASGPRPARARRAPA